MELVRVLGWSWSYACVLGKNEDWGKILKGVLLGLVLVLVSVLMPVQLFSLTAALVIHPSFEYASILGGRRWLCPIIVSSIPYTADRLGFPGIVRVRLCFSLRTRLLIDDPP